MDINSLTKNPAMAMLLKKVLRDNKIELVTIELTDGGELDLQIFYDKQKVLPEADFLKMTELLNQ